MTGILGDISVLVGVLGCLWLAAYVLVNKLLPRHDF